jgi:peptidyl-prolyl cis-trans isomerase C
LKSKLSRLLREPLFHFLLLGAALFGVYRYLPPQAPAQPAAQAAEPAAAPSRQILLSLDQLTRLALGFQANWGREPTAQELNRMVEDDVKEEILYREGVAMGLDKDDEIVRRRMAQKMQFLAEDVAAQHAPTDAELRAFFNQNKGLFEEPARLGFRHLYFSPDHRASNARADAEKALGQIKGEAEEVKVSGADPFMFQDYYRDKTPEYLRKEFGPGFAEATVRVPTGSWQGPIESGFGWHLVFVDTLNPAHTPAFEEVEPDVKQAWLAAQKVKAVKQAYDEMRAKYTILMPAPPPDGSPPPKADAKAAAVQSIPSGVAPE